MSDKWKIRVSGYGTFDFEGTEEQAEEMRCHKANYERGTAIKWRETNQTPVDDIYCQMADLWDRGEGVPADMMDALRAAKRPPQPQPAHRRDR